MSVHVCLRVCVFVCVCVKNIFLFEDKSNYHLTDHSSKVTHKTACQNRKVKGTRKDNDLHTDCEIAKTLHFLSGNIFIFRMYRVLPSRNSNQKIKFNLKLPEFNLPFKYLFIIVIIIILLIREFFTPAFGDGFSLEFPQVLRILVNILADLNNTVPWRVSTCPLISKSYSLCTNSLVTVASVPITLGIHISFMFQFFSILQQGHGIYLSFRFPSLCSVGMEKSPTSEDRAIGLMSRVFANGPGDRDSIQGRVITKIHKMVLDAALLNTHHYKVWIKSNVEQSREGVASSPTLGVVAIKKVAFESPSTKVANFIFFIIRSGRLAKIRSENPR